MVLLHLKGTLQNKREVFMYVPRNKKELFTHLDNEFNSKLDINEQNDVWIECIKQSIELNRHLEKTEDDHHVLLNEYIEDRAKRGLKSDYD